MLRKDGVSISRRCSEQKNTRNEAGLKFVNWIVVIIKMHSGCWN